MSSSATQDLCTALEVVFLHLYKSTTSAESLASTVSVQASASSWDQSVGQVWLSSSSHGFASKLRVHTAQIQKGTLLTLQCNTQDQIHTVFWWQFIVLQMFLFNLEGHLNRNRNIILWVDRNQSVSHHRNWTGAVMRKVQFIYKNKTEMIKDVH